MAILMVFVLLLAVGLALAYRLSASVSARKRAVAAIEPLRSLQCDLTIQAEGIKESTSQAASRLGQDVRSERLRAISIDTIKNHASGLRLQALKDAGLNTVLDLQGWSAQRLSGVRGVGPKSASSIAAVVQTLTHSSSGIPVRCPLPPFSGNAESGLLRAVYVDLFFEAEVSTQRSEFKSVLDRGEQRLAEIAAGTTFRKWLMAIFSAEQGSQARQDAEALVQNLQDDPQTVALKRSIEEFLADLQGVRHRQIPQERLMAAYEENAPLFEWMMARVLGSAGSAARPAARQRHDRGAETPAPIPTSLPGPMNDATLPDLVHPSQQISGLSTIAQTAGPLASEKESFEAMHVEFGRLVPGPPPPPQMSSAAHMPETPRYAKTATEALQQLDRVRATQAAVKGLEGNADPTSSAPQEELVMFQVGQPVETGEVNIPLPAKSLTASRKTTRWIVPSDTMVIQGIAISGSYFFCGSPSRTSESFVLDTSLPIARETQQIGEESAFSHRYGSFTPHVRFRYLEWLAVGTRGRDVPSGFGKLYFQGLERRLLQHLRKPEADSDGEIEALLREVQRIDSLFLLTPNSVSYQANSLLQFFAARAFVGASMPALPSRSGRRDELPFQLRLGLGCFMKENLPIPAEWALCWAYAEPTIFLRTAPLRCPNEFEAVFRHLYEERYGQGLILRPNKTMLSIEYQPMWSGADDSKVQLTFTDVPDVKALTGPQTALSRLVSEATEMIDGYSRLLGPASVGAGTLEAMLRLPASIWLSEPHAKLEQLRSTLVETMLPTTCDAIFKSFEAAGEITSTRILELAKHLRIFGVGFEPDVLAGARKPKPADYVVLFPLLATAEDAAPASIQSAAVAVILAAILALADGHASDEEAAAVDRLIGRWAGLSPNSQARLRAVYRLMLQQPPTLLTLKARLEALPMADRKQVASALTQMAASDGVVSPEEVKLLERIYRILTLEAQMLYADLHSASNCYRSRSSQALPSPVNDSSAQFLDPSRLTRLRQQSSEVSELLAGVFAEEADPVPVVPAPQFANVPVQQQLASGLGASPLPGLTPRDQLFVTLLVSKSTWSREELLRSAAEMQIMLDGTLERINEAALDRLGDFLIEGDDPIYVQQILLEAAE